MRLIQIGNMNNDSSIDNPQNGRVYSIDGLCPTINTMQGGGGREPMILANINPSEKGMNGDIHSTEALSPTITTNKGEGAKIIVSMRGRNPDNPSDRTVGSPTEQRLEENSQGICNTITTVQKDNMVLEKEVCGTLATEASEQFGHNYMDGMCKTLKANKHDIGVVEKVKIKQATKDGYTECVVGGVADLSFPDSDTRRGRVQRDGQVSPTLTASGSTEIHRIESAYRIRKLTPKECGRLMGVKDDNIHKMSTVNSNSQLYKQFGNSIVVNCMIAMFSNLNIQGRPRWDKIKDQY